MVRPLNGVVHPEFSVAFQKVAWMIPAIILQVAAYEACNRFCESDCALVHCQHVCKFWGPKAAQQKHWQNMLVLKRQVRDEEVVSS